MAPFRTKPKPRDLRDPGLVCVECGKPLGTGYRNRMYCGNRCKKRYIRRRHGLPPMEEREQQQ